MLVVTIEMWPHGDSARARTLERLLIVNDGTGDLVLGNYVVCFPNEPTPLARVQHFVRRHNAWELVYAALKRVRKLARWKEHCA